MTFWQAGFWAGAVVPVAAFAVTCCIVYLSHRYDRRHKA